MKVELIDKMGSDLSVVNAARVSYAKHHEEFQDNDAKLLRYLAGHGHVSPFFHPQLSFRITCNIAVGRQLMRHQIGLAVNEVSRRYVTDAPEFDLPDVWRSAPGEGQSKQGSGAPLSEEMGQIPTAIAERAVRACERAYSELLRCNIAPEQARLVLPMLLVTQFIWTGSLMAFIRICKERLAPDAQAETRAVALCICGELQAHFPESVKAWGLDA